MSPVIGESSHHDGYEREAVTTHDVHDVRHVQLQAVLSLQQHSSMTVLLLLTSPAEDVWVRGGVGPRGLCCMPRKQEERVHGGNSPPLTDTTAAV